MTMHLHANRSLPARVHGGELPWLASPEAGVERRPLERDGGEVARATTIVRYRPGSRFAVHVHELGEEFFVLEGCFSDEHGHHRAGSYVRNPPGSRHAPFSDEGCVIFVKLRQMHAGESKRVVIEAPVWQAMSRGHDCALLFDDGRERVTLERLAAGAAWPARTAPGGEELFVVEGGLIGADAQAMQRWSWQREPAARHAAWHSPHGALLWTKRGHVD